LFLLGGLLGHIIGFVLALPVALLMQYLSFVVDFFSSLPFAAVKTENLSVLWLILFYIAVTLFYLKFRKRNEFPFS
jgi:type IV secretory pathway VirB6-like protein